jgi:hypothetical protein
MGVLEGVSLALLKKVRNSDLLNSKHLNNNPITKIYICLIPKNNNPSSPNDYRPISLCNVTLKIITKTLANRLKTILIAPLFLGG